MHARNFVDASLYEEIYANSSIWIWMESVSPLIRAHAELNRWITGRENVSLQASDVLSRLWQFVRHKGLA